MKNIPYELIARYLAGECNDSEKQEIIEWSKKYPDEMAEFYKIWNQASVNDFNPDIEAALTKVNTRIEANNELGRKFTKKRILWALTAAATIAVILFGFWWSNMQDTTTNSINRTLLTVATQEKETIELLLPDGSKVWLNHLSNLKYPEIFQGNTREVYLEGEAFFDISPNANNPFIIYANNTQTRVVGTSFGVKALKETDEVIVTVATGIINFSAKEQASKYIELKQGEQGICKPEEKKLEKKDSSDLNLLAWKTKILTFKDTPLLEVAKLVEDIYHTPITVDDTIADFQITSTFNQLDLKEIIQIIEITLEINAEIGDSGILLTER